MGRERAVLLWMGPRFPAPAPGQGLWNPPADTGFSFVPQMIKTLPGPGQRPQQPGPSCQSCHGLGPREATGSISTGPSPHPREGTCPGKRIPHVGAELEVAVWGDLDTS